MTIKPARSLRERLAIGFFWLGVFSIGAAFFFMSHDSSDVARTLEAFGIAAGLIVVSALLDRSAPSLVK